MSRTTTLILAALIGLGSLAGLYGAVKRYQVEEFNRRVELALDFNEVKALSGVTNEPMDGVLARFRAQGVSGLAITEDTIGSLVSQGTLTPRPAGSVTQVGVASSELLERIARELAARGLAVTRSASALNTTGPATQFYVTTPGAGSQPSASTVGVPLDFADLRNYGLGLDPGEVAATQRGGLDPVARISNFPGASPITMTNVLSGLKRQGARTVIFQGVDVLGFRGAQKEAAEALQQSGLYYGQVEFGKQRGDDKLAVTLKGNYIRVHSISDGEMGTLDENEMIERFVRAARERNIRLCYVRMETFAGADPVGTNVEYLRKIAKGIERHKEMDFGLARPFGETGVPKPVFGLIALGAAAGLALLLTRLVPVSEKTTWTVLIITAVLAAGAAVGLGEMGRKLVALLAALVFPTLACLRRDVLAGEGASEPAVGVGEAAKRSVGALLAASAVTALGIAQVVGLLATRPFMVKANQFLGIKAAHAVPILLIGLLAIVGLPALNRPWAGEWEKIKARTSAFLREPTRIGPLLLTLVALVALAMIVARTGNDPGVGVSGFELKMRSLLDKLLPVRPRTKEFLVGHPAFVLALALYWRGRRKWAVPLFVVGVVGQVSLLNTFCHIHTPLWLSFIRDITGLVFGALIGLGVFWLVERLLPKPAVESPASVPFAEPVAAPSDR